VTDQRDIDSFLALGAIEGVILTSFGDMLKVPGSRTSLEELRAGGADMRVVYSPLDAVDTARRNPDREVVFFGVGFETTMPATALAITSAASAGIRNFTVFCAHKTMPQALRALLSGDHVKINGLLLPGHVTTIIGAQAFDLLASELGIACAVAGFEPLDIMLGVESVLGQSARGEALVDNTYSRAVKLEANQRAAAVMDEVFQECDAAWRGLGAIPGSGVRIRNKYSTFDASVRFQDALAAVRPPTKTPCRCGEVLRGLISPTDCEQFGSACTPEEPIGPCMVSTEGACAAAYLYGGRR